MRRLRELCRTYEPEIILVFGIAGIVFAFSVGLTGLYLISEFDKQPEPMVAGELERYVDEEYGVVCYRHITSSKVSCVVLPEGRKP